ncbi:MAG: glycoside hydrolase family 97 protein, partial [Glaciecola sp.]|nr:glycoside hydrolase family 97 protein [Glaciecola sp.]
MKAKLLIHILIALFAWQVQATEIHKLASPNGKVEVVLSQNETLTYQVDYNNQTVISPSEINILIAGEDDFRASPKVLSKIASSEKNTLYPEIRVKSETIVDEFNEVQITFSNQITLHFRAYNNGVAYRYETAFAEQIIVQNEIAEFNFARGTTTYFPEEESFYSHNERSYNKVNIEALEGKLGSTPALINSTPAKVLITETALRDYAGLWLQGNDKGTLSAVFPTLPTKVKMGAAPWQDRNEPVVERADYLAQTEGSRTFPWRIIALAENDVDLLTNQLSYQLAIPNQIGDTSWIKPGKVAWDWYNANNLHGVDFESGLNTETYKFYIDFAAANGIEYVILDEGWYPLGDLMGTVEGYDVPAIIAHAKKKGVGIILWTTWLTLRDQFDEAMDRFTELGAVGIKPDFFQRDDQEMVNFYWKIAEEAAKHKLLVDPHGAYKPAGLRRTFPNVISREGVKGLEWNKWSYDSTPEHNTTLPFIRMVAGPMDYTPGAMSNAIGPAAWENIHYSGKDENHQDFSIRFTRPMSQTTRAHQVALFTIFESPLQMMADSPAQFIKEQETATFISKIPTVWDETKPIEGAVGDYIVMARRSNDEWFLGALTDEYKREFSVSLDFLAKGRYQVEIFQDGVNANKWAEDYKIESKVITNSDSLS